MASWKDAEWVVGETVLREKAIQKNVRDLSAKVGSYLAGGIRQKRDWALAMYAQIQKKTEPPRDMVIF